MTVTRKKLEALIGDLKSRRPFAFAADAINRRGDQLDVFNDVDDLLAFRAADFGDAPWFLAWTRTAETSAFDRRGKLVRALAMRWGGPGRVIQDKFARAGWIVRIEHDATARDGYESTGTLVLPPNADEIAADLRAMHAAFDALTKHKVIALSCVHPTQSAGWENVADRDRGDHARTAVFWTSQGHEAFDATGNLARELPLYWRGDAAIIAAEIERAGLRVAQPDRDTLAIVVNAAPRTTPQTQIESFENALAPAQAPPRRPTRRTKPSGPLPERARFRSPDRKPVFALAYGSNGLVAVAQNGDNRGPPSRVLAVVADDSGEVRTAFATQSPFASVRGLRFLRDGRLIFAISDLTDGRHLMSTSCWDPSDGQTAIIATEPHNQPSGQRIVSIDAEERLVCICAHEGVVVRAIPARGESAWPVVSQIARPQCFYPYALLSPDGRAILWSEDDRQPIMFIDLQTGTSKWEHRGVDTVRNLTFDPRAEHVLFTRGASRVESISAVDGQSSQPALVERGRRAGAFVFHPTGDALALGGVDGTVRVLSYPALEPLGEARVFDRAEVTALAFDARGEKLAVGSHRGEVVVVEWVM